MKTVVYSYSFNYFGGKKYKDRIVTGASVDIAVRAYKGSEVVTPEETLELSIGNGSSKGLQKVYLSDVFEVSVDRKTAFSVNRNLRVDNLFRLLLGYDKIEGETVGYSLDVFAGMLKDTEVLSANFPKDLVDLPVCEPIEVTRG